MTGMLAMTLYERRKATATPVTTLVLHHDPLVRAGLAHIIERDFGATVVQGFAVDQAEELGNPRDVDVALVPTFLGGLRIDEVRAQLQAGGVRAPLVALAHHDTDFNRSAAAYAGARGYLTRSDAGAPGALARLLRHVLAGTSPPLDQPPVIDPALTSRECDVLLALSSGLKVDQIAVNMMIATSTARGYVQQVYRKLGVHSRAEAVEEAQRHGLLEALRVQAGAGEAAFR